MKFISSQTTGPSSPLSLVVALHVLRQKGFFSSREAFQERYDRLNLGLPVFMRSWHRVTVPPLHSHQGTGAYSFVL